MNINLITIADIIRDVAATEIIPRWRNLAAGDVSEKTGPDDLVTVADGASERALSKLLTELYPQTVVVGEEGVEANPALMDLFKTDKTIWVIDPIDGTMGFSKGQPEFDVMLALVQNGELLAGWIYAPVDDEMLMGGKEYGVFQVRHPRECGDPIDIISETKKWDARLRGHNRKYDLSKFTGILGKKLLSDDQRKSIQNKESHFNKIISTICAGHDYAKMIRGEAHFAYYGKCMPWDHLPGLAMLHALGFHYTKQDGSPYVAGDTTGGLVIAPDRESCERIRRMLAK